MAQLTQNQRTALRQLLDSVKEQEKWDYYKAGGWAGQQLLPLLEEPTEIKPWITEEQARGLFAVANIEVLKVYTIENQYWPSHPNYDDLRRASPWFLVKTTMGLVEIGWRKNVMSINWEDTKVNTIVTEDDVTKSETMVHAWSIEKAVSYLVSLGAAFKKVNTELENFV